MRFTLISDQDIPDPHPPYCRVWRPGGPRASGDEGGLRDASGKASLRYNSAGRAWPASREGAKVASLLREQRLSGQASQPSGIYRYLTRLRLHFASPHRLSPTYSPGSCRCHF